MTSRGPDQTVRLVLGDADEPLSRAEALVELIERSILDGKLEPGQRLGVREELQAHFRVARGTLNEALRVLQTRDLIEARTGPGGGVFVASGVPYLHLRHGVLRLRRGRAAVQEAILVRNALEPLLAAEAARSHDAQDLADFEALVDRMAQERDDPATRLELNWELHVRIAAAGNNTLLTGIYTDLMKFISESTEDVEPDESFAREADETIRIHRELVEAIASRDPKAAVRAAYRHTPPVEAEWGPEGEPG